MNSRILKVTMALGLVLVGLGISIAGAAINISASSGKNYAVASSHTIGDLFTLINTNNPARNSQFLMLAANNGKVPMTAVDYAKNRDFAKMGSVSPLHAQGPKAAERALLLTANSPALAMTVKLKKPTAAHINELINNIPPKDRANIDRKKLEKVLVWFDYQGYAMFLFNPWSPSLLSELAKWKTN